ncbi:MAG: signal peptidase II, partial [Tidjanibacter sp.]|nr:signal peptidase II [Tidjanibacter sp.]
MKNRNIALLVVLLLVADQALKIWIKTHLALGESITVFPDWFFLRFIENPGAAFGFELGGNNGKLFLSLFRIVAIGALCWLIPYLNRKTADKGLIVGFVLILAGAIGNMIDSAFYGMIFSESTPWGVAELFPEAGGYASLLHGKVVDMFYFP